MASDGDISFMSQSGAFITAVLDWAAERDVGFKDIVSLGNKAVLDESDFVAEWGDDPDTDVILGYLEDINDGSSFVQTAREVTQDTPIVLVKSGRTDAGASAAAPTPVRWPGRSGPTRPASTRPERSASNPYRNCSTTPDSRRPAAPGRGRNRHRHERRRPRRDDDRRRRRLGPATRAVRRRDVLPTPRRDA